MRKYKINWISLILAILFTIFFIGGGIFILIMDPSELWRIIMENPVGTIALTIAYIAVLNSSVKKSNICLAEEAFQSDDFGSLCELVNTYYEGEDAKRFDAHPEEKPIVFAAAKKLVSIVESPENNSKSPEFEDYYWLGLMYEEGFGTLQDKDMAVEYFKKALTTRKCWDGDAESYQVLVSKVKNKLQTEYDIIL